MIESGRTLLTNNRGQPRYLILQIHLNIITWYTAFYQDTFFHPQNLAKNHILMKIWTFDRLSKVTKFKIDFLKCLFLIKLSIFDEKSGVLTSMKFQIHVYSCMYCIRNELFKLPQHTQVPLIILNIFKYNII